MKRPPPDHPGLWRHKKVDPARWPGLLDELMGRIGGRFARVEPRRRARAFVLGLLADLPRKNCWIIAGLAGDAAPDGMQYLLAAACQMPGRSSRTCPVRRHVPPWSASG